jgi:hypothetical protein
MYIIHSSDSFFVQHIILPHGVTPGQALILRAGRESRGQNAGSADLDWFGDAYHGQA